MTIPRMLGLARDPQSMSLEERLLAAYYERLNAYAVDKSRVIVIEFQSADPELAARAANTVAERYLVLQQVAKQDQARSAGQWLSGELEKLRSKVAEAEAKVEEFRAKSNIFMGANNTSLSGQQLSEINTQISAARAQKADAETRARLIRDQLRSGQSLESADVTNSELIRRLSEQRVTLRAQLAEQSSTLLPQHPRIKELRAQIADLDQQIRTEGERVVRQLENDAKVAGARLDTIERHARAAQEASGVHQRPGCAIARARARSQVAARPVRILSCQISRGDRAGQHCCGARRRAHHLPRSRFQPAAFAEEGADRADRGARHVLSELRVRRDRRAAERRTRTRPCRWSTTPHRVMPIDRAPLPRVAGRPNAHDGHRAAGSCQLEAVAAPAAAQVAPIDQVAAAAARGRGRPARSP